MTALTREPLTLTRRGMALYGGVEQRAVAVLRKVAPTLLRVSLGLVFVWFGALKLTGTTPVADLVARTVPWPGPEVTVPALGAVEVLLGLALALRYRTAAVCAVMVAHLCGTFLVLVTQPDVAFQAGNPLLLTTEGEFVVKNLVLISAGLVLAAGFDRAPQAT